MDLWFCNTFASVAFERLLWLSLGINEFIKFTSFVTIIINHKHDMSSFLANVESMMIYD